MDRTIKAKTTAYGLVELRTSGSGYAIYVSGCLKLSTADLMYALNEFEKY